MELPLSQLRRPFEWLTSIFEPKVRETNVQVLRIPADGSPPLLIRLNTVETSDNVDSFLSHIPDFRRYWGDKEGFHWRDIAHLEVMDQSLTELNGAYWGWKSFAMDLMPRSEHTGFHGDAFIAKTPIWENDENGAVYEDVPETFIGSKLMHETLQKLHEKEIKDMRDNARQITSVEAVILSCGLEF
ncbi:uncharacterized protein KY384_000470 [Bacidia gigantensis]|uniref:uncharacterized protein n=1 Tax=Bacidia gigantensis TaxID=2732470 RepID=UPI001D041B00|nr:uncharacterized protein KY384_000470 [Bacidia gigantensis]KAG8525710.1 hypothetical protein KY384_000470 [Bacidia gigantensis]